MAFDKSKHLIRVQGGREYLPVAARLIWFREEHPDWGITTCPVQINVEKQFAIFQATITGADGRVIATATKMETVRGFSDWLEKSETGAVGRALAYCGYGTQFAPELEEGERLADAPRDRSAALHAAETRRRSTSQTQAAPEAVPIEGGPCQEPGCTHSVPQGPAAISTKKYGRRLCLNHQRAASEAQQRGRSLAAADE